MGFKWGKDWRKVLRIGGAAAGVVVPGVGLAVEAAEAIADGKKQPSQGELDAASEEVYKLWVAVDGLRKQMRSVERGVLACDKRLVNVEKLVGARDE